MKNTLLAINAEMIRKEESGEFGEFTHQMELDYSMHGNKK